MNEDFVDRQLLYGIATHSISLEQLYTYVQLFQEPSTSFGFDLYSLRCADLFNNMTAGHITRGALWMSSRRDGSHTLFLPTCQVREVADR